MKAQNNDFEAGLFNVGIGSVLGGVGAIINKEPGEKFGKTLLKGLGQGALGGYLVFESKRLVREFAETGDYNYVWPSKIVNSAGTSIIENAAANRDFWSRWHLNIGFNRIEVNTKEKFRLSYRIMPFALIDFSVTAFQAKLDWDKSLKLGTFVFRFDRIGKKIDYYGQARSNSIIILSDVRGTVALPHELLHVYQNNQFSGFNSVIKKPVNRLSNNWKMDKINRIYSKIFYTDYNYILFGGLYFLVNPDMKNQGENNFFEKEAEYYTANKSRDRIFRN